MRFDLVESFGVGCRDDGYSLGSSTGSMMAVVATLLSCVGDKGFSDGRP